MTKPNDRAAILRRVIELAAAEAGRNAAEVTAEMTLQGDLDFDSLATMEFTMNVEDAFGLEIPDEQAVQVRTVGQAADLVAAALTVGS